MTPGRRLPPPPHERPSSHADDFRMTGEDAAEAADEEVAGTAVGAAEMRLQVRRCPAHACVRLPSHLSRPYCHSPAPFLPYRTLCCCSRRPSHLSRPGCPSPAPSLRWPSTSSLPMQQRRQWATQAARPPEASSLCASRGSLGSQVGACWRQLPSGCVRACRAAGAAVACARRLPCRQPTLAGSMLTARCLASMHRHPAAWSSSQPRHITTAAHAARVLAGMTLQAAAAAAAGAAACIGAPPTARKAHAGAPQAAPWGQRLRASPQRAAGSSTSR
jgi:hypothetical protein